MLHYTNLQLPIEFKEIQIKFLFRILTCVMQQSALSTNKFIQLIALAIFSNDNQLKLEFLSRNLKSDSFCSTIS